MDDFRTDLNSIIYQAAIKKLAVKVIDDNFLQVLPPTPRDLLRLRPDIARSVYSAARLPMSSPLDQIVVGIVRSRINLRGAGPCTRTVFCMRTLQCAVTTAHVANVVVCGYNRTCRTCTHTPLHDNSKACMQRQGSWSMPRLPSFGVGQYAMDGPGDPTLTIYPNAGQQRQQQGIMDDPLRSAGSRRMENFHNAAGFPEAPRAGRNVLMDMPAPEPQAALPLTLTMGDLAPPPAQVANGSVGEVPSPANATAPAYDPAQAIASAPSTGELGTGTDAEPAIADANDGDGAHAKPKDDGLSATALAERVRKAREVVFADRKAGVAFQNGTVTTASKHVRVCMRAVIVT
jgi:hypothetical protein